MTILPHLSKKYNLIFARHGNTALNEDGDKIRGWKDVPLSPKGLEEAHELGKNLEKEQFDLIISSDLQRAMQTAEIVSKKTKVPIYAYTRGLRPWHAGVFQGKESNKIYSELQKYISTPEKSIPEGESFNTFKKRYLDEIGHIKKMFKDKTVLIVAHHRNNVLLDAWIAAGEKPDYEISLPAMNTRGISPAEFKVYKLKP